MTTLYTNSPRTSVQVNIYTYIRVTPGAVSFCEMPMNYLLGVRGHDAPDIYLHF